MLNLSLYSTALGDLLIQQGKINGVAYATGGIGLDERAAMEKMANDYSLKIVIATASGNYLADAKVRIENLTGEKVFECTATGPWLYVNLPAGTYKVTASLEQKSRMREVTVGTGLKSIMFHWKP